MCFPAVTDSPKIALVIDTVSSFTGAERVLAAVLELYPGAPIYTLAHNPRSGRCSTH